MAVDNTVSNHLLMASVNHEPNMDVMASLRPGLNLSFFCSSTRHQGWHSQNFL